MTSKTRTARTKTEAPVVVTADHLRAFILDVLGAMGMGREAAELTAELMVRTDLRGVDSHGIGMLPKYVEWWRAGYIAPEARPEVVHDDGAIALLDGKKGLGHWVSVQAMRRAIDKARALGIGFVAVRNSNHFGAAGNYSMMALEQDMIGFSTTNSPYLAMVPTFARAPMLGTNPISFAAPAARHAPFVLDRATTTVAVGKLTIATRWRKPIPKGWALDERGVPTTDPTIALAHRLLTPLGGSRELGGHKGYGLGVMVDILSGVLGGAVYGNLFFRDDHQQRRVHDIGHAFFVIDPARFRPLEDFKRDMDDMIAALKATPTAAKQTRVYVAGEPEAESEARRKRDGIPMAPALVAQCDDIADALAVAHLAR